MSEVCVGGRVEPSSSYEHSCKNMSVVGVVEQRNRYVLLGRVEGRALIAVVADDEFDDATVLVSVYEPDVQHG